MDEAEIRKQIDDLWTALRALREVLRSLEARVDRMEKRGKRDDQQDV